MTIFTSLIKFKSCFLCNFSARGSYSSVEFVSADSRRRYTSLKEVQDFNIYTIKTSTSHGSGCEEDGSISSIPCSQYSEIQYELHMRLEYKFLWLSVHLFLITPSKYEKIETN